MPNNDHDPESGSAGAVFKGVLLTLGVLFAVVVTLTLAKPLFLLGATAAAGYLGYRLVNRARGSLPASESDKRKALGTRLSNDDFSRRMRELEAIEKRLDAEIGKDS